MQRTEEIEPLYMTQDRAWPNSVAADDEPRVTLEKCAVCERFVADLDRCNDAADTRGILMRIFVGEIMGFAIMVEGRRVGSLAISREVSACNSDIWLVVNALAGDCRDEDLTLAIYEAMRALARITHCAGIRAWTSRPGLLKKLAPLGVTHRYVLELKA